MNKSELVKKVAEKLGATLSGACEAVEAVLDTAFDGAAGEGRCICGRHIFKRVNRAARKGRNPRTGEVISIPARTEIVYRRPLAAV